MGKDVLGGGTLNEALIVGVHNQMHPNNIYVM